MSAHSIHTCQQSKDLDRIAIEKYGISGYELMTRAGQGAFRMLQKRWPDCESVGVLCGRGNNGGDGYVLAAAAKRAGLNTTVFRTGEPGTPDSQKARDEYRKLGGTMQDAGNGLDLAACDVLVDALLGVGLTRDVGIELVNIFEQVESSRKPVLALDIPSGIDGDTGAVRGCALRADATATFISTKMGLLTGEGRDYTGVLELDTLDVPQEAYREVCGIAQVIDPKFLPVARLKRKSGAHKGSAGHVLIIGGNKTMQGAALMAGQAAARAGAGLVSIVSIAATAEPYSSGMPELRNFVIEHAASIAQLLESCNAVGIGPGLGQDDWAREMWNAAREYQTQLVVDADALNLLAAYPCQRQDWILTPHPGEAGRLLDMPATEIQMDRVSAAHRIAERFGGICVLKGAGTIVAGGQHTWICDRGNPGMATGGMGDVLTGVICALRAQGLSAEEAACLGVWLHATAGDASARETGAIGMIATDLLPGIRKFLNEVIDGATTAAID